MEELLRSDKFVYGGRILSNRGLDKLGINVTYSNCYVLAPPEDNIEDIYDTAKRMARVYSYGGGVGISLGNLRPNGTPVNNSAKSTTGPVSFMRLFDTTTDIICQSGRRGALMLSLPCEHPDIIEFINSKSEAGAVTKANISVMMSDDFLSAADKDNKYTCKWKHIEKNVDARGVMYELAYNTHDSAEPGILYWDRVKNWSIRSNYSGFEFAGVNPCGEQSLSANGSCLLSAINLGKLVLNPFTDDAEFDYKEFSNIVKHGVTELNVVLDEGMKLHPLQEIRDNVTKWREIGVGLLGFHDMLIKMGFKYGGKRCIEIIDSIGHVMINSALQQSALLASVDGPFPAFNLEETLASPFLQANAEPLTIELIKKYGLRNSQLLTIAPTGSTAPLVNASWAAEPIFAVSYDVRTESLHEEGEKSYSIFTPIISELMEAKGITDVKDLPDYVVTSHQIPWRKRVDVQATWQKYIDAAISSTVNVPNHMQIKDVYELYMYAWRQGCKGITVYRDGCSREGVLTDTSNVSKDVCPACGAKLEFVEGCKVCPNQECGYSACGI